MWHHEFYWWIQVTWYFAVLHSNLASGKWEVLFAGIYFWILDSGFWILDSGFWNLLDCTCTVDDNTRSDASLVPRPSPSHPSVCRLQHEATCRNGRPFHTWCPAFYTERVYIPKLGIIFSTKSLWLRFPRSLRADMDAPAGSLTFWETWCMYRWLSRQLGCIIFVTV